MDRDFIIQSDIEYLDVKDHEEEELHGRMTYNVRALGSEESYEELLTNEQLIDIIAFFTFHPLWQYLNSIASYGLFWIVTYNVVFDKNFEDSNTVLCTKIICNIIIVVDIIGAYLHSRWKEIRKRAIYKPRLILFHIGDVISLPAIPIGFIVSWRTVTSIRFAEIGLLLLRLHRIYSFFQTVSSNAGRNNMWNLALKHLLVFAFIFHAFASIWFYMGGYYEKSEKNYLTWIDRDSFLLAMGEQVTPPVQLYILSLLHVVGGVTSVALGGGSTEQNESEKVILICFMSISLYYLNGMVIGTFTNVCCNNYFRQTRFTNRFKLIARNMASFNISKTLMNKMLDYYIQYWKQEDAINHSLLFDSLPLAYRQICLLDKYWFAISQTHLLARLEEGLKRSVASRMTTKMCVPGEVICDVENQRYSMLYIAKGSVHLLSVVDGESSLITLGVGSCLGEINLIFSTKNPTKVIAATYCTIYVLKKSMFWREIVNYRLLKQSRIFHKDAKKLVQVATTGITQNRFGYEGDPPLQRIKQTLQTEDDVKLPDYTKIHHLSIRKELYDVYVRSRRSNIYSDGIFINTTWPWILNSDSIFLQYWEILIIITIFGESIGYPLEIAYYREFSTGYYSIYRIFGDTIYIVDIIMKIFTVVETEEGCYTTVAEITLQRMAKLTFVLDLLAIFPFNRLMSVCGITEDKRILSIICVVKLLKIYRIVHFLQALEYNLKLNVSYVRLVKYVLYMLYAAYIFGCVYYMVLCFEEECYKSMALGNKTEDQFTSSVMTAMLIMSGTGGVVDFFTFPELVIILLISIIGTLAVVYLISDYSATLTLASRQETSFIEMIHLIRNFIESNKISKSIEYRINQYFIAQWLGSKGVDFNAVYADAPKQLLEEFQVKKYASLLSSSAVFHNLSYKIIRRLAMSCETVALPPNEYVTYAGEVQRNIYMVEKGFCEVISGSSQKVEKILGPMTNFCVIETLLEVAAIYNIKTITHVMLVKIRRDAIKEAFLLVPEIEKQLTEVVSLAKSSFAARRLFTLTQTSIEQKEILKKERSFFIFPKSIIHSQYIDFMHGWQNYNVLRYFMLRRTIMPYGQFICYWELSRAVFALLSAMLHPTLHIYQCYFQQITWIALALDFTAVFDVYVRMHVCYYNKQGILVTHPRMTAVNYLTSSFVLDLLALFPTDYAIYLIETTPELFNSIQAFSRFNRVLQIYRLPDGFSVFLRDIFDQGGAMIIGIKYLLITIVIFNTLSMIIINSSIEIRNAENNLKSITPKKDTWISSSDESFTFDNVLPINTYFIAVYWVITTAQQLSFGNVIPHNNQEVIFVILIIVIGYFWFTFVIVIISNNKATINEHLTIYQNHMQQLTTYLKQEKIPKSLQTLVIDHFEHVWKRTQGMNVATILNTCHLALRKDCALFLYKDTFKLVSVFTDTDDAFHRKLGTNIGIYYFLKDYTIIKINDIVKTLFIVHKGHVNIIGPDGKVIDKITRGGLFGNVDDTSSTRSMITVMSSTNTDLLVIETVDFYELLEDYPVIKNRINRHLLLNNISYICSKKQNVSVEKVLDSTKDLSPKNKFWQMILTGRWIQNIFLMAFMISYILISYQMAFKDYNIAYFVIGYCVDVMHIFKIYLSFIAPYQDEAGDLITDKQKIRRQYLKFSRFYLELAAVLPIEIFALIMKDMDTILQTMCFLRMNRAFRLWHIFNYFNVNYNFLNVNVLGIEMASIAINMVLLTHTEACLLIMVGTGIEDITKGWIYNDSGVCVCVQRYLCALYFAVSFTSFAGYNNMRPRNFGEIVMTIFLTLINKVIISMVIGNMSAIAQSYVSTLTMFDYGRRKMELYLKHSLISHPLYKMVMKYTYQLWALNRGVQVPIFMNTAPSSLKRHVKSAAYGYHIRENLVFVQCHDDFLGLVCKNLKVHIYFADDVICQQGDVNGTMYFIHRGNVNAYYVTAGEETHVDSLMERDCFGMVQGLFPNSPHTHTFRAMTVTTIVSLELKNWVLLLQFYPAAKHLIYENMYRLEKLSSQF